jgi:hypothetical protein
LIPTTSTGWAFTRRHPMGEHMDKTKGKAKKAKKSIKAAGK